MKKLNFEDINNFDIANKLNINTIKDIETCNDIIGQIRAKDAILFGLDIKSCGYNIYVSGEAGLGKSSFTKKFVEEKAKDESRAKDLCYVYNFKNPKVPNLLQINAGLGSSLKKDMDDLIDTLLSELPKALNHKEFENDKTNVINSFSEKKENIMAFLEEEAKVHNFNVKTTNSGVYFMPIVNNEVISEEQFVELDEDTKAEITKNSNKLQKSVGHVMTQLKKFEEQTKKEIDTLEYETALFTVGRIMTPFFEKYIETPSITDYLLDVKEDVLENLEDFISMPDQEEDALAAMLPWSAKKGPEEDFFKFKVNVIVDNKDVSGAPVIVDYNPTYSNLIGYTEFDSEYGHFVTDFMKINAGLLHKANGGYLILRAEDLFSNPYSWEALSRALKTKELTIEPIREFLTVAVNSVKPEKLDNLNVKVIIIGSYFGYDLLHTYDDDFKKLFKIRADFDYEMDIENVELFLGALKKYIDKNNIRDLTKDACVELIIYAMRQVERVDRLSINFDQISSVLEESNVIANKESIINKSHIKKAIELKEYRANLYEDKLTKLIQDDIIMIDTTGAKIGQINALAVLDLGDYSFAKPSRVTATTYVGKSGVVNIEKESKLSGAIHDKGVQVITGYLGHMYAKEFPLSMCSRVCFEQNYSGIDGDSASTTELYAILSSISELPIKQGLAVTGSMNQHGQVQPIGGVTYKIEGFFDICNKRGLTGDQGVIIPYQNIKDIVLKDDVLEAIKNEQFFIYAITNVDQGIELLTGYESEVVHKKVKDKLKSYYELSAKE